MKLYLLLLLCISFFCQSTIFIFNQSKIPIRIHLRQNTSRRYVGFARKNTQIINPGEKKQFHLLHNHCWQYVTLNYDWWDSHGKKHTPTFHLIDDFSCKTHYFRFYSLGGGLYRKDTKAKKYFDEHNISLGSFKK